VLPLVFIFLAAKCSVLIKNGFTALFLAVFLFLHPRTFLLFPLLFTNTALPHFLFFYELGFFPRDQAPPLFGMSLGAVYPVPPFLFSLDVPPLPRQVQSGSALFFSYPYCLAHCPLLLFYPSLRWFLVVAGSFFSITGLLKPSKNPPRGAIGNVCFFPQFRQHGINRPCLRSLSPHPPMFLTLMV